MVKFSTIPKGAKVRVEFRKGLGGNLRSPRSFVGNPAVTRKPIDFHRGLPSPERLAYFFSLAQGDEAWKTWRQKAETEGASSVNSLTPGCWHYQGPDIHMQYLAGKIDTSPLYTRPYTLATSLGHLFEDLVISSFLFLLKPRLTEGCNLKIHDCGVLYDHTPGFEAFTASLDGSATGGRCKFLAYLLGLPEGMTYPWDRVIIECKAPTNKKYSETDPDNPEDQRNPDPEDRKFRNGADPTLEWYRPPTNVMEGHPKDYMTQVQRQLSAARSQRPTEKQIREGDFFATFPGKEYAILLVLEVPYKSEFVPPERQPPSTRGRFPVTYKKRMDSDEEGKEFTIVEKDRPFVLKIWSTRYDRKFDDLTKVHYKRFISAYDRMLKFGKSLEEFTFAHSQEDIDEINSALPAALFSGAHEVGCVEEDVLLEMFRKPTAKFSFTERKSKEGPPVINIDLKYTNH